MSVKKIQPKTEADWLRERSSGIGSSEIGTIAGLNKYQSLYQWWRIKTGLDPQPETNDAMVRGHLAEDFVANYFAYKTDSEIIKASADNIIYFDPEHPWRRVTPDRFCWIPGLKHDRNRLTNKFILECKTYNGYITDGEYPQYWYAQVMYQLGVCGCPYGYLAWVDSHLQVDFVRIDFDADVYRDICTIVDYVWQHHIIEGIQPDPTTSSDAQFIYPHHTEGKSVEFDNEMANKIDVYRSLSEEIAESQAALDALKDEIILKMQDAEVAKDLAGVTLCTYKSRSEFDEEALKADDPLAYASFCKSVSKFDKTAYKKAVGSKQYAQYTRLSNVRTLRIN